MRNLNARMFPFAFLFVFSMLHSISSSASLHEDFLECLYINSENPTSISKIIYTPSNSSYSSILLAYAQNLRFATPETPKPQIIVTPVHESQIPPVIYCSKSHGIHVRIRSGGHDFEGNSYVSDQVPYVIIDLFNLRSIEVDVDCRTAWVQAGADLGEVYYRVASMSNNTLAFPAGYWPSVGVGGHLSGGGYGTLVRKYGLAADNVVDARVVDVKGRVLDRESMGEDLFWAIRGGVGASFCVIVVWKIRLVEVPETVTVFVANRTSEQNAAKLVHQWQYVAPFLPEDVFIGVTLSTLDRVDGNGPTVQAKFNCLFLGRADALLPLMSERFPELGITRKDCRETKWVESFLYYLGIDSIDVLINRNSTALPSYYFKAKSDFVQEPIPEEGIQGIMDRLLETDTRAGVVEFSPFGGRMDRIPETEIPFPHRAGNLFIAYESVQKTTPISETHIEWIRSLHDYLSPYVSKNPRSAYAAYRDYDLGINNIGHTSYEQARIWGYQYYLNNFDRLVQVKTMIDPDNFFKNEQSIPSLSIMSMSWSRSAEKR